MLPISKSTRAHIRRLYFAKQLSFEEIALRIGIPIATVRSAVVIDGGAVPNPSNGPFAKEQDS